MNHFKKSLRRLASIAIAASCVASLGMTAAAGAVGNPGCGDTITTSVVFTGDLDCTGLTGPAVLSIGADYVTVDLNGFSIIGTDGYETVVDIRNRYGVTLRNGTIDGGASSANPGAPAYGVAVVQSTYTRLENIIILDTGDDTQAPPTGIGLWVDQSTKTRISNVESVRNELDGARITASTDTVIKNSSFSDNWGDGMVVDDSDKVQVEYTLFDGNDNGDGLDIQNSSSYIRVKGSSASNNFENGIEIETFSSNLRFYQVRAHANEDGLESDDVIGLVLQKSSFSYNSDDGADLDDTTFQFVESSAIDNADDGLYADDSPSFLIKKGRTTLNGEDGIDIEDNFNGPASYKIEYTVSNSNYDSGFEIDNPVTARSNSAAGNLGSNVLP